MPRRNRRGVKRKHNKGNHQRRRTTRGYRMMSKFEKYMWYGGSNPEGQKSDTLNHEDISANN